MGRLYASVVAFAFVSGHAGIGAPPVVAQQTPRVECASLTDLHLPDIRITDATPVPASSTGIVRAAHCKVAGVIGSEIRFEVLLPEAWNGRFFMGGGGGFVGSIQNSAAPTVNAGYATAGTDTGHQAVGTDASWAYNNVERRLNFGYLAIHRTAETAKAVIASYYGGPSSRNYFAGCSRGGGQALMEAQRFPTDFDGIVAGAPAYDWTGFAAQMVRNAQVAFPDPNRLETHTFTPDTMKMIEARVLEACDAIDGLKDGIMNDPRQCRFDINTLAISDAQKHALGAIYQATRAGSEEIYPGQPFGGEGQTAGWPAWITGGAATGQTAPSLRYAFGTGVFKYFVFNDPDWNYSTYDLSHWRRDTALAATYLNATDPNLDAFKARGGKLILWHGWADPALTPLASIRYYDQVASRDSAAHDYFRMFLMPGVLHCGNGTGPDIVDWTTTIADWVERGRIPERVIASKVVNGATTRTRPLCPYPLKAEYTGSGSIDDETSFACR
jgi:feruloyl esterase